MALLRPDPPPYDPLRWAKLPLAERGRLGCQSWALQGYGAPVAIYVVYALKIVAFIAAWVFFCSRSPSLGGLWNIGSWWLAPLAFQKAIVWSMLFEGLGLGCGSGPLTGRYFPPIAGALHFARPGTTKLPLFPNLPVLGGIRRTWLDAGLYLAVIATSLYALMAPTIGGHPLLALAILVPLLGIADKTVFLAFRSEHYWVTVVVFVVASDWIPGAKAVQLALWFWAGVSKLNHHFPTVVCAMMSNGPFTRSRWLRKRMYRSFPTDLRPSTLAVVMAHAGTALELGVPISLITSTGGTTLLVGMALMLALHLFITSSVPMGVPLEWNVMVVYGAIALFWAHPEATVLDVAEPGLALGLIGMLLVVPLLGNLLPSRISFLLSMRYYAGNWAYSTWLFSGESYRKLDRLKKSSPWIYEQLDHFYDRPTSVALVGKVLAFRMMHLHGRALTILLPKAVDGLDDLDDREIIDGELVAGTALGWNFGDGHLHRESLLKAIQAQCHFEPGELRCVFVEAQRLGGRTLPYRVVDACDGELTRGELEISTLRQHQPWGEPSASPPARK